MKKLLSFLLVLSMIASMLTTVTSFAADEGTAVLSLTSAEGEKGETVYLELSLDENPGMMALTCRLNFDITAFDVVFEYDEEEEMYIGDEGKFTNFTPGREISSGCNLVFSRSKNTSKTGLLVTIPFVIAEDAAPGVYDIVLEVREGDCGNYAQEIIPVETISGKITVKGDPVSDDSVSYSNCVDEKGNPLNVKVVSGQQWVEEDGAVKMPHGPESSFLLFDTPLTTNRVEATIVIKDNILADPNHRNGLVFALTDHDSDLDFWYGGADVSYYWVFVDDWNCVHIWEMGKYQNWSDLADEAYVDLSARGIDVTQGVTLAAEWNAEGNIKVYADGELILEANDPTPITGNYYGMVVNKWGNTQGPEYEHPYNAPVTSFVAGDAKLAITATAGEGGTVEGSGDFYRGQSATVTATPNEGYNFVGWYENDQLVSSDSTYTFKVAGNCDLTAKFTKDAYKITVESEGNGTVAGGGAFGKDAKITVTATPDAGYRFIGWYENDVLIPGAGATYTFEVTAARELTAKFEKIENYSIAVDGINGDRLRPYFVNGVVWVDEENGGIKMPAGPENSFLLFDTPITNKRVEATIVINDNLYGDGNHRNGIVFALTDINGDHEFGYAGEDVSYYWAFVNDWSCLSVWEMGANGSWGSAFSGGESVDLKAKYGIDVTQGVTIAAEWDDNGHIRVFANGYLVFDVVDETPLTGSLYGTLVNKWGNTQTPNTYNAPVTSFVAGGALATKDVNVEVSVNTEGTEGTEEGGTVTGAGDYYLGQNVTLEAKPNEGFAFKGWFKDGATEPVSTDATYEFQATEACNLIATFTMNNYEVTVPPVENGTVTGGGIIAEGTEVTVTATPNVGYKFAGWFNGETLVSSVAEYTFKVTENVTLTAKFEKVEYTIPVDGNDNKLTPVFINGVTWVEEGGKLKMPAGPVNSFLLFKDTLANNRVEATIVINDNLNGDEHHRNGIVFALTDHDGDGEFEYAGEDVSYYWAFVNDWGNVEVIEMGKFQNWHWLSKSGADLSALDIDITQGVTLAAEWDAQGHIKVYANGILVQDIVDETPLTGNLYGTLVNKWGNSQTPNTYDAPITSFVAGGALATKDVNVNVTFNPTEGSVTGTGNYYRGQNVTLEATANDGYAFLGWFDENGELVSADSPYTFKVTADCTLTARFTQNTHKVTVTAGENGTVTGGKDYAENSSATVIATPNAGYKFAGWYENDELVSTDATYTFAVTAARTLTAKFEKITYSVAVDSEDNRLNPYFVNGVVWVEENGNLKMPAGPENSFLLFDTPITNKRVEATIVVKDNLNADVNHRNGIVFALTDHDGDSKFNYDGTDVSYYWAFINDWGCVEVIEMGKEQNWHWLSKSSADLGVLDIDITQGVTLAAEWDAQGHIKVYANGILVQDIVDETPLTGNLYGTLVNKWGNTQDPNTYDAPVTSFVAGGALVWDEAKTKVEVTVDPVAGTATGAGKYCLGQSATLTATAKEGYKFVGWFNGETLVSADAEYKLTVTADCTLTAKFEKVDTHTCAGTKVPGQSATCTVNGWNAYYKCTDATCGKLYSDANCTTEITDLDAWKKGDGKIAAGHNYGTEWKYKDENGHAHVCGVCGEHDTVVKHTSNIDKPTETEDQVCTACGHVIAPATGHIHKDHLTEVKANPATCTKDGNKAYYKCSCEKYFEDANATKEITDKNSVVIKAGHNYGTAWEYKDENGHAHVCGVCGEHDTVVKHTPNIELPTETEDKVCKDCGYVIAPATGHVHKDHLTEVKANPATCTKDGNKAYYKCSCEKYFEDANATKEITDKNSVVIKAGHNYGTAWEYKDENGHAHVCGVCGEHDTVVKHTPNIELPTETEDKVCKDCGYVIAPATGHIHKDHLTEVKANPATCTKDGNKAYYKCSCEKYFEDANAAKEITDKNSVVIKAGHNYGTAWEYKDENGHAHVCGVCGEHDTVVKHTPNIDAPTETEDKVCKDCGYVISPATGHIHKDHLTEVKANPATCTKDGNKAYYKCSCNKYFEDANATKEITDKNSVVIKAGHNYGTLVEEVPAVHTATELKAGMKAHYFCEECNTYFTADKVATTKADLVIAAPTHVDADNDGKCDGCDYNMKPVEPETPSTTVDLGGNVTLEGKDLTDGMFTFELYSADANFATSGTPVTATNKDGKFAFENITFTEAGIYYFVITANVAEGTEGITFDESKYQVTVTVEENGEGGLAVVSTVITKKGASEVVDEMGFTNVYKPTDTPPQTGDITLWIGLAAVLLGGIAVMGKMLYTQKKRRVED